MQTALFTYQNDEKVLKDIFLAYYDARKNKRNTINALRFERHYEHELFRLHEEIMTYQYNPKPSICFVVNKPVKREIFAADFRDRVVHHMLYNYLSPIFEKRFIHDSYSCRKGKGTHYGIRRIDHFMRSCSENYNKYCYILKLDIKGYFMAMDRSLLYSKVVSTIAKQSGQLEFDLNLVIYLLEKVIFNDPTSYCIVKGKETDWDGLPPSKSLFHAPTGKGLPIGNLTSQLFGNVYLNDFDHFVKHKLKIKHYGRYVDDMIFVHNDKDYLIEIIPQIQSEMDKVGLKIHPNKILLNNSEVGVQFLGQIIKPYRKYISNRTKNNFYEAIQDINQILAVVPQFSWQQLCEIRTTLNAYLGIVKHANSFNLRKAMIGRLIKRFHDFYFVSKDLDKVIINKDFWEWHFSPNYRFIS